MFLVRSVGEIQSGHIHAAPHQVAQSIFRIAGRADGADDFGATPA
jgi:hypothetical protein